MSRRKHIGHWKDTMADVQTQNIVRLEKENAQLRDELAQSQAACVKVTAALAGLIKKIQHLHSKSV
jgi:hypothetical protein